MRRLVTMLTPLALLVAAQTSASAQPGTAPPPPTAQPAPPAPVAPPVATPPAPAAGSQGGVCYGNQTCDQGLTCEPASNQCLQPPAPAPQTPPPAPYPQGGYAPPQSAPPAPAAYPNGGYAPPPPMPPPMQPTTEVGFEHNQGVMVGVGLGLSSLSCEGCDDSQGGLGFDVNLGGFMNPRLALMYDASGWFDSEDEFTQSITLHAFAVQYWVSPKFWLKGALGIANARVSFRGESESESGTGVGGGLGFEIMQSGNFALDLSGRFNRVSINDDSGTTLNFVIGARWK